MEREREFISQVEKKLLTGSGQSLIFQVFTRRNQSPAQIMLMIGQDVWGGER